MTEKQTRELDFDAIADAEVGGALAVSRSAKNRGARMTKYGLTTAQLRVVVEYAHRLLVIFRQAGAKKVLHIGKATLRLREHGREEILAMRGL